MELVYLWVDNYKNISNQGFNFSPRFECEFKDGKLIISDKKKKECKDNEYLENFFGKNINITAIVGENGSGKSSVLEILAEIFRIEFNKNKNVIVDYTHTFNFFLTFKIKDKTYEIKSIDRHDSNNFSTDERIENMLDYHVYSNDKDIENKFLFDNISISQMLVYDDSQNKNFKLSSFMYLPIKIEIRLCDFEKKFEKLIRNDKLYPMNKNEHDSVYIQDVSNEGQTQIGSFENINNDKYHQFLILKLLENNKETHNFYLTKEEIEKELTTQKIKFVSEVDFNKYFKISEGFGKKLTKEVSELKEQEKDIYINKHSDFFEFDFFDEQNRRYSDLSHGEKTLFGQLLNIYYNSKKSNNDNLLFLFDEPELSLHPQWQKNYINEIYNLIGKLGKNNHFIFTSHSPFLLSDLPKENVIFLEKYKKDEDRDQKEGNCKNVTNETNIETFGANIHTLLSNGFFMSDGLMGEFAKSKIIEILEYLNDTKNEVKLKTVDEKQIKHVIDSIGEDFLRNKLLNIYNKKYKTKSKDDEIIELKAEIERLKNANNKTK